MIIVLHDDARMALHAQGAKKKKTRGEGKCALPFKRRHFFISQATYAPRARHCSRDIYVTLRRRVARRAALARGRLSSRRRIEHHVDECWGFLKSVAPIHHSKQCS